MRFSYLLLLSLFLFPSCKKVDPEVEKATKKFCQCYRETVELKKMERDAKKRKSEVEMGKIIMLAPDVEKRMRDCINRMEASYADPKYDSKFIQSVQSHMKVCCPSVADLEKF